jgi:hypothetical protein
MLEVWLWGLITSLPQPAQGTPGSESQVANCTMCGSCSLCVCGLVLVGWLVGFFFLMCGNCLPENNHGWVGGTFYPGTASGFGSVA